MKTKPSHKYMGYMIREGRGWFVSMSTDPKNPPIWDYVSKTTALLILMEAHKASPLYHPPPRDYPSPDMIPKSESGPRTAKQGRLVVEWSEKYGKVVRLRSPVLGHGARWVEGAELVKYLRDPAAFIPDTTLRLMCNKLEQRLAHVQREK